MILGGSGIFAAIVYLLSEIWYIARSTTPPGWELVFSLVALGIFWGVVLLIGGLRMKRLENFGLAMTACILAILPLNCCCLLGVPFGIWGLVALFKPEVKDAFSVLD
jgi:hypothetical protein